MFTSDMAHVSVTIMVLKPIIMIQGFGTEMPWQTVQTQTRLLLGEQSGHGLHHLPYHLHILDKFIYRKTALCQFYGNYSKHFGEIVTAKFIK